MPLAGGVEGPCKLCISPCPSRLPTGTPQVFVSLCCYSFPPCPTFLASRRGGPRCALAVHRPLSSGFHHSTVRQVPCPMPPCPHVPWPKRPLPPTLSLLSASDAMRCEAWADHDCVASTTVRTARRGPGNSGRWSGSSKTAADKTARRLSRRPWSSPSGGCLAASIYLRAPRARLRLLHCTLKGRQPICCNLLGPTHKQTQDQTRASELQPFLQHPHPLCQPFRPPLVAPASLSQADSIPTTSRESTGALRDLLPPLSASCSRPASLFGAPGRAAHVCSQHTAVAVVARCTPRPTPLASSSPSSHRRPICICAHSHPSSP